MPHRINRLAGFATSQSMMLTKYVYTYWEYDCGFKLLLVLHIVQRTISMKIDRHIALNKNTQAEQR